MADNINFNDFADRFNAYIQNAKKQQDTTETSEIRIDQKTFAKEICKDTSVFQKLDINKDGYITEKEFYTLRYSDNNYDGIVTKDEIHSSAMRDAEFSAKRDIDKWFTNDVNRDGIINNAEAAFYELRMCDNSYTGLEGRLSSAELAKVYNTDEKVSDLVTMDSWIEGWTETIKEEVEGRYGIQLSQKDIITIKKYMIQQLNTWLFKTGDEDDSNLYNQCNNTAYTRLITHNQQVSCCGGSIDRPPLATKPERNEQGEIKVTVCARLFRELSKPDDFNTSDEMKNRLCWAMFPTKTQEKQADMTPEEYASHQADWNKMRNMKASDFRELLKPENKAKLEEFESHSYMSVPQVVRYIDIVEEVTGKSWDSDGWEIGIDEWTNICEKVNGTDGDDERLNGKTRADIPENRQALLRFLEEKGWLYEQFK